MEEQQIVSNGQQPMPPMYKPTPVGIGGWLILPIIGLVAKPLIVIYWILTSAGASLSPEVISYFTTPDSPTYLPFYVPLVIGEILMNLFFGAAAVVLLILLFLKKRVLPTLIVAYWIFNTCFIIGDMVLTKLAIPQIAIDAGAVKALLGSILACCIWIPYFLLSERVKNTFVR